MTISIEHVGVWVNDLEKMKSFYEKYFNAVATKKYYNPKTTTQIGRATCRERV